jgi:hypothetical protein
MAPDHLPGFAVFAGSVVVALSSPVSAWLTRRHEARAKCSICSSGAHMMRAGSAWLQPPRIRHKVLDYSDDCEVLEIVLPADFKTVELE